MESPHERERETGLGGDQSLHTKHWALVAKSAQLPQRPIGSRHFCVRRAKVPLVALLLLLRPICFGGAQAKADQRHCAASTCTGEWLWRLQTAPDGLQTAPDRRQTAGRQLQTASGGTGGAIGGLWRPNGRRVVQESRPISLCCSPFALSPRWSNDLPAERWRASSSSRPESVSGELESVSDGLESVSAGRETVSGTVSATFSSAEDAPADQSPSGLPAEHEARRSPLWPFCLAGRTQCCATRRTRYNSIRGFN